MYVQQPEPTCVAAAMILGAIAPICEHGVLRLITKGLVRGCYFCSALGNLTLYVPQSQMQLECIANSYSRQDGDGYPSCATSMIEDCCLEDRPALSNMRCLDSIASNTKSASSSTDGTASKLTNSFHYETLVHACF